MLRLQLKEILHNAFKLFSDGSADLRVPANELYKRLTGVDACGVDSRSSVQGATMETIGVVFVYMGEGGEGWVHLNGPPPSIGRRKSCFLRQIPAWPPLLPPSEPAAAAPSALLHYGP